MQPRIQILTNCPKCDGEAYLPDDLVTCEDGQIRLTYEACWNCGGSGRQKIWIELNDLLEMLADHYQCNPMEVDWLARSHRKPVSQFLDSLEAAGIYYHPSTES